MSARAAVLVGFGQPLETRRLPVPEAIEPGALLVRIECATVCGTDVHLWQGRLRPDLDLAGGYIPGHECAGRVLELGADAGTDTLGQPLGVGDLVIWANESCGRCPACTLYGQPGLCPHRRGHMTMPSTKFPYLTGAFAELSYVLPRSERIRVPDGIPAHWASAAGCAVRTVMHAFERLGPIHPGEDVLVQGAGPIGLFSVAAARAAGARHIAVIGGPPNRLAIAEAWGADLVLPLTQPVRERATAIRRLNEAGPDIVIEASGGPDAFAEGLDLIRPAGRYVLAGAVGDEPATVSPGRIVGKHLTVLGTWSASARHYWRALEFLRGMRDRGTETELLFGAEYDLDDATRALTRMATGEETKPIIRSAA